MSSLETDFSKEAELVFRSGRFPAFMVVTTGVRDYDTGHYIRILDKYGTTACIEMAMRIGAEKGLKPFESIFSANPEDFTHVYKQEEPVLGPVSLENLKFELQKEKISETDFCEFMGVDSLEKIKVKDISKAHNAVTTISKAQNDSVCE